MSTRVPQVAPVATFLRHLRTKRRSCRRYKIVCAPGQQTRYKNVIIKRSHRASGALMELQIRTDPDALYQIVAPIYFNNDVVGVLDGKHSQGRVGRRVLTGFRIDRRTSFKHPVIGFVIGFVLVVIPLQALIGDLLGIWWVTLASPLRLVGSFFPFFLLGIYLLWGVVSAEIFHGSSLSQTRASVRSLFAMSCPKMPLRCCDH